MICKKPPGLRGFLDILKIAIVFAGFCDSNKFKKL
jgi:hypothetical protein